MDKFSKLMQLIAVVLSPIVVIMALYQPTPNYMKALFFGGVGILNLYLLSKDK